MEAHAFNMGFYLSTYQFAFLFAFSADERMASIIQNLNTYLDTCSNNGYFFTQMARFVSNLVEKIR
jgi:hypothetical protein